MHSLKAMQDEFDLSPQSVVLLSGGLAWRDNKYPSPSATASAATRIGRSCVCNWSETLAVATEDYAAEDRVSNWEGGAKICPQSLWSFEALRLSFTMSRLIQQGKRSTCIVARQGLPNPALRRRSKDYVTTVAWRIPPALLFDIVAIPYCTSCGSVASSFWLRSGAM